MNRLITLGIAATVALIAGCTTSPNADICDPGCRPAFTCVHGACVSACNPVCGTTETCMMVAGIAQCVGADAAVGTDATDIVTAPDVQSDARDGATITDVPALDVQDGASPVDVLASADGADVINENTSDAQDATMPIDVVDAAPTCGIAGLACCSGRCDTNSVCTNMTTCDAIVRGAGECTRSSDCTAPQVCGGPETCGDRGCYQCVAPFGSGVLGAACTSATDCMAGLCRSGACSIPCAIGGTGDADCATAHAGYVCEELFEQTTTGAPDAGTTTVVTLGVCRQGCQRSADCTAPAVCHASDNFTEDRLDFICGVSAGVGAIGATCTSGSDCASFLCLPGPSGTSGTCTGTCTANGDCPALAPRCVAINWGRPSGANQPGMACAP